jgi:hypothetical protein
MGADLQRTLPAFRTQCLMRVMGVVTKAIEVTRQAPA